MKLTYAFAAGLFALTVSAEAQAQSAFDPGMVFVIANPEVQSDEAVILFGTGENGQVGGDVLSQAGDVVCPAAWSARVASKAQELRFTEITLSQNECPHRAELEALAKRLGSVATQTVGDAGIELQDAAGTSLLRLVVGG